MWWVIVASVLAIGGIAYGLLSRKDRCALPGITEFEPNRIPIMVIPDHLFSSQVRAAIEGAVDFWNASMEIPRLFTTEILDIEDGGSMIPVMPFIGTESRRRQKTVLAYVDLTLTEDKKGILGASVKINTRLIDNSVFDLPVLTLAIAHEFGHVLGLAHDDYPESIMYRKAIPRHAEITAKDAAFIQKVYEVV